MLYLETQRRITHDLLPRIAQANRALPHGFAGVYQTNTTCSLNPGQKQPWQRLSTSL
jgi:hypothetical protein